MKSEVNAMNERENKREFIKRENKREFIKRDNKEEEIETAENEMFNRVRRGFDPDEVMAYVDEMNRNMQDASKNYEKRMAEMKSALALANRERDKLLARFGVESADALTDADVSQFEDEAQAKIAELQGRIEDLQKARAHEEAEMQSKLDDERAAKENLEKELETASTQIEGLKQQCEQHQSIQMQYEQALGTIEELKAKLKATQDEKDVQSAEYATAQVHFDKVENENTSLKTELSRFNVENALLEEKNEAYKNEIAQMKKEIKEKAYVYAEKLSAGEDELRKEQVKLKKKVQMQNYHIEQASTAVEELARQLQAIRESFAEE